MDAQSGPVIDLHNRGIGDIVVACWLVHSARAVAKSLRLNPRGKDLICRMLSVDPPALTNEESVNWAKTDGLGHRYEYALAAKGSPKPRFAAWAEALGLQGLVPVRPPYRETEEHAVWAENAWRGMGATDALRVAIFPEANQLIRRWPAAYFMDLADALKEKNAAVIMVGARREQVDKLGCRWYAGFPLDKTAALITHADLVIGNDSGPVHLAGTLGVPAFIVTGPTDGGIVFDHDPNVKWLRSAAGHPACYPCHFALERGYRSACKVGGCRALMTFTPDTAFDLLWPQIRHLKRD